MSTPIVEVTRFVKQGGPLTKQVHLNADGSLSNNSINCRMASGTAYRELVSLESYATMIEASRDTAFGLGALRADLPDIVPIATKKAIKSGKARPGAVARSKENIAYKRERLPSSCSI